MAANMLPKGSRPRQNPAASPLRPVKLNVAGGDDGNRRHPMAPDAPAPDGAQIRLGRRQAPAHRRRQGQDAAEDEGAAPSRAARTNKSDPVVEALAAERARDETVRNKRPEMAKEFDATVHAVATTQPRAVLGHALSWLNLLVGDLKGRSAALRRSRRRLQKVRGGDGEGGGGAGERGVPAAKDEPQLLEEKEAGLLEDLERALAVEDKHLTALLKQAMQAQGVARGSDAGGKGEEGGSSSALAAARGAKRKVKARKAKDVAAKGVAPAILGAPPSMTTRS